MSGMSPSPRLHRSELCVPGSNVRMLEKAPGLGADIVMLDLEDAVAPDDKPQARLNIIDALREQDWSACSVSLRINGLDTEWAEADMAAVAGCGQAARHARDSRQGAAEARQAAGAWRMIAWALTWTVPRSTNRSVAISALTQTASVPEVIVKPISARPGW